MIKYLRSSAYIRKPFLIYDFASDLILISLYMRRIFFSFLSVNRNLCIRGGATLCCVCYYILQNSPETLFSSKFFLAYKIIKVWYTKSFLVAAAVLIVAYVLAFCAYVCVDAVSLLLLYAFVHPFAGVLLLLACILVTHWPCCLPGSTTGCQPPLPLLILVLSPSSSLGKASDSAKP